MNWRKPLVYGALALGVLLVLRVAVSLLFGVLGFLWAIVTTAVAVLALGGLLYGGYKVLSRVRGTGSASDSGTSSPESRVERLKERYANGELSEDEFERRLDREFGGPRVDSLDRELTRERE